MITEPEPAPVITPEDEEAERERRYCEELRQKIIAYELDPRNFFKLKKRGIGRKI